MKKLLMAIVLAALIVGGGLGIHEASAIAPSAPITVVTTAGGTIVVPQGMAQYQLCVTNTGASNPMYCSIGQVPTTTNFNFFLPAFSSAATPGVPVESTWCGTSVRTEPMTIGTTGSLLAPDTITCIATGGSTTATYFKR